MRWSMETKLQKVKGNDMTRKQKREIKATYRYLHGLTRVSDADVFAAYVGTFTSNRDFIDYLNSQCNRSLDGEDAWPIESEYFDVNGAWTLEFSDMAFGVYVQDFHYFWRNP